MMLTSHYARATILGIAALLSVVLVAPGAAQAEEQVLALAPSAGLSWDEMSGYGAVETNRAMIGYPTASVAPVPSAPGSSISETRVAALQQALLSPDLGSMQEEALLVVVGASISWDETSGYGAVEVIRAASALGAVPAAITTQVSSDVRWAPESDPAWMTASRAAAARRAATAFPEWDAARWSPIETGPPLQPTYIPESSAYQASMQDVGAPPQHAYSPESSASAPPPLREATNPVSIPATLASGERAESAHLATIALPDDSLRANCDDRIAKALFDDESDGEDDAVVVPRRSQR